MRLYNQLLVAKLVKKKICDKTSKSLKTVERIFILNLENKSFRFSIFDACKSFVSQWLCVLAGMHLISFSNTLRDFSGVSICRWEEKIGWREKCEFPPPQKPIHATILAPIPKSNGQEVIEEESVSDCSTRCQHAFSAKLAEKVFCCCCCCIAKYFGHFIKYSVDLTLFLCDLNFLDGYLIPGVIIFWWMVKEEW